MWQNSNRTYQRMHPEQDGETEASQRNNRTRKMPLKNQQLLQS